MRTYFVLRSEFSILYCLASATKFGMFRVTLVQQLLPPAVTIYKPVDALTRFVFCYLYFVYRYLLEVFAFLSSALFPRLSLLRLVLSTLRCYECKYNISSTYQILKYMYHVLFVHRSSLLIFDETHGLYIGLCAF